MTLWNRLDEWRQAGVWEQPYELDLGALETGVNNIQSWTIDWGDASTYPYDDYQTVQGDPSFVDHTFASGVASATITATATDATGTCADRLGGRTVTPEAPTDLTAVWNSDGTTTVTWSANHRSPRRLM